MSIQFGDILKHNNLLYPIVDINDVKGGLRSIATFSSIDLSSEFSSIPEKYKSVGLTGKFKVAVSQDKYLRRVYDRCLSRC